MSAKPLETPGAEYFRVWRRYQKKDVRRWDELPADEKEAWDAIAKHVAFKLEIVAARKQPPYHPRHD